jgi:VCBS repeat-containing protein
MSVAFGVPQNGAVGPLPLQIIGIVRSASGYVTLTRDDGPPIQVSIGDLVCHRDIIETDADAQLGIRLLDDTLFNVACGARVELREYASASASHSTVIAVTGGSFAFAAGRLANGGTLTVDTPLVSVRGRSHATGFGILTMAALTFSMMEEARGADPDGASFDNDTVTYKDLHHGVFELITKERVPRHIVVDDPGETVVLNKVGSSISVNQVANSAARMEELHEAQQDVLANLTRGPAGSGTPPGVDTLQLQPINFNSDHPIVLQNLIQTLPSVEVPPVQYPLPALNVPGGPTEIDTVKFDATFATTTGTFTASSPLHVVFTYGLSGGTAATTVLSGQTYDLSQASPYGILYLNSASGAYAFVPNADAINALSSPTTTGFVITVSDGQFTTSQTFVVAIDGVNDTALISGNTSGAVVEAGGVANAVPGMPTATGTLTDVDVDNPPNTFTTISSPARSAGGYGTFTMTAGGVWSYTLDNSNSKVQALNVGDTLIDRFTVTSIDGTPQVVTITIQGSNDAAVVSGDTTGSVVEAGASPGTPVATGTLVAADVDSPANTFVPVGTPTVSARNYGSFTITTAGVWTYTLDNTNTAVQALNTGDKLTDSFTVITADGTAQTVTITINGSNDAAIISGTATGSVTEAGGVANAAAGTPVATGTLTDIDSDNASNAFIPIITPKTSAGGFGTFTMTALGTWTYTLDDNNATVQALNVGATLTDHFMVTTVDGTPQLVTITIRGANDAAIISGTAMGSVIEAGVISSGMPVATGTLTDTDVDNPANTFALVATPTASARGYGSFTMTTAGVWTYTLDNTNTAVQALNNGDKLTDTFTVTTADGTAQTVAITINGSNDAAVISGTASGSVIEAGGVANATPGTPAATGTLTDVDPDNTFNTFIPVTTPKTSAGGFGTFTMSALGTWSYALDNSNATVQALNVGTTLTDQFTVTTIDGTAKLVTITIHGANDAAIISGTATGSVLEAGVISSGMPVVTGTLTDSDVDNPANTFAPVAISTASAHGYGSFTMTVAGVWAYTLDNTNNAVQALNNGDKLTDSFTVTTVDGTAQTVTITINGSNDAAVISGTVTGSVTEAGGVANGTPGMPTATGTLTDVDPDNTFNTFTPVTTPKASTSGFGTFTMTALGAWAYTLDNSNATVQALNVGATLTDEFTVTTVDGTSQLVTVTIHGANDAAIISGTTTGSVLEAGTFSPGTPIATGTLSDTDVDNPANTFTAVTSPTDSDGGYGTFTMTASGLWTYTLDNNNAVVDALNVGDTLTDHFTVTSIDGTTQEISIAIHGASDADPNDFDNLAVGSTVVSDPPFVYGTPGSDSVAGGGSISQIVYGGAGDDTLNGTGVNDTIYGGSGNDTIKGNNGDDVIYGGSGQDKIDGSNGNDIIIGGFGADKLSGGNGDDVFVYLSVADSRAGRFDTISDFVSGTDKIDLTALGALGFVILALNSTSSSVPPHTIAWIYDSSANETVVYVNSTDQTLQIGDSSLLEVHLQGIATIDSSDFIVDQAAAPVLAVSDTLDPAAATLGDAAVMASSTSDAPIKATNSDGPVSLNGSVTAIDVSSFFDVGRDHGAWSNEITAFAADETATPPSHAEAAVFSLSMEPFKFVFEPSGTDDSIHPKGFGATGMSEPNHPAAFSMPDLLPAIEQHLGNSKAAESPGHISLADTGSALDADVQKGHVNDGNAHSNPPQASEHSHAVMEALDKSNDQPHSAADDPSPPHGKSQANPPGQGDSFKFLNPAIVSSGMEFLDDHATPPGHQENTAHTPHGHGNVATVDDSPLLDDSTHVPPGLAVSHGPHGHGPHDLLV